MADIRQIADRVVRDLREIAEQYNATRTDDDRDALRGEILGIDHEDDGSMSILLQYGGPTEWINLHHSGIGTYHSTWAPDGRWEERSCKLTREQVRWSEKVATLYRIADRAASCA